MVAGGGHGRGIVCPECYLKKEVYNAPVCEIVASTERKKNSAEKPHSDTQKPRHTHALGPFSTTFDNLCGVSPVCVCVCVMCVFAVTLAHKSKRARFMVKWDLAYKVALQHARAECGSKFECLPPICYSVLRRRRELYRANII